jgi:hypothetical protein
MLIEQRSASISDAYSLFLYAMNSPVTRDRYSTRLRRFFSFIGIKGEVEEQCRIFIEKVNKDNEFAFRSIISFLHTQKEREENVASVKRLKFIESPILKLVESPTITGTIPFTYTTTSSPLSVIFAFDCDTTNFETFESWIKSSKVDDQNELFDLCYILHSTFTYTFQDQDRKNQATKCVYPLSKSVREEYPKLENLEDFKKYKDDMRNPLVQFYGIPRIVDQGLGFLNFLSNLYHLIELKHTIQRSILRDYLTDRMFVDMKVGKEQEHLTIVTKALPTNIITATNTTTNYFY